VTQDPDELQPLATKTMTPPLDDFAKTAGIGYLLQNPGSSDASVREG